MTKITNLYIFIILFILFSIPLKKKACVVCANSHVFCAISHTFNKVKKNGSSLLISELSFWHGFCSIIYIEE